APPIGRFSEKVDQATAMLWRLGYFAAIRDVSHRDILMSACATGRRISEGNLESNPPTPNLSSNSVPGSLLAITEGSFPLSSWRSAMSDSPAGTAAGPSRSDRDWQNGGAIGFVVGIGLCATIALLQQLPSWLHHEPGKEENTARQNIAREVSV